MSDKIIEYIKLHKISLNQDLNKLTLFEDWTEEQEIDYSYLIAQIGVLNHILDVYEELTKSHTE